MHFWFILLFTFVFQIIFVIEQINKETTHRECSQFLINKNIKNKSNNAVLMKYWFSLEYHNDNSNNNANDK